MQRRLTRLTAGLAVAMVLSTACASDGDTVTTDPTTAPPETDAPNSDATSEQPETSEPPESTSAPADTTATTDATTPPVEEADGGTLVVAITEDPGQYNPALTTSGSIHTRRS